MKGFVQNIEDIAVKNEAFRRGLYTAKNCQLVVMALKPKEDIRMEVHKRSGVGVGLAEMPATGTCHTKKQTHRVVFEVNVDGAEQWQGILNNVENLQKSFGSGTTELEVVAHGKGLGLILKINESMRARLQLVSGAGVCFAACENTMRRLNLKLEDLMPFATTVDSGVAEVVRKQEAGWSYIKSGS